MEYNSVRIHRIGNSDKSSLTLEGTVLVLEEKNRNIHSETEIPVELISISECRRFEAKRLIIALLCPVVSLILGGFLAVFPTKILGFSVDSTCAHVCLIVMCLLLLLSIVGFCIYLVMFLIRVQTVVFCIAPDGDTIEFWKSKKDSQKIDELIEQIKQKQAVVETRFEHPAKNSIYSSIYSPVLRIIVIFFLFALPALSTERVYLFLLLLLPGIWLVYKGIQYISHPKEYRKAMRFHIRKDWDNAIRSLNHLKKDCPEYLPAYTLLVNTYIHTKRFDDALNVAASLPDEYRDLAQDIQTDVWYFKRLYERRKSTRT